ncbi:unnamed protein product [Rangifer tarandus platyrhynchus]|uniref:Uncharacterized protein n=1 Tax=Rangifer tarandus platyrhynchus TaxID=3082113 RepID=A0ABN8XKX6_RANTA|nr:unnamed protein product [Rangifer tarandus platyrhynchus]
MSDFFSTLQSFQPRTVACQASLSVGCSRQECWSGLPCPTPGNLPDPRIKPRPLKSPALAGVFYTTSAIWEIQWDVQTLTQLPCHTPPPQPFFPLNPSGVRGDEGMQERCCKRLNQAGKKMVSFLTMGSGWSQQVLPPNVYNSDHLMPR